MPEEFSIQKSSGSFTLLENVLATVQYPHSQIRFLNRILSYHNIIM